MKISPETLNILKNFSNINHSIVVKEGNVLRTMSPVKNILAKFTASESFPKDFALYELNEFLSGLTLFKEPDFDFDNNSYLTIKSGRSKVKYFYSDASVITAPPVKDIELPSVDVEFELSDEVLASLLRASSVYQLPDLSLIGDGSELNLVVRDKDNQTSNNFNVKVGDTNKTFTFNFKMENLKIVPDLYKVVACSTVALFTSSKYDLCYWIALEPDSTFEG
jgi:hypothetical protein